MTDSHEHSSNTEEIVGEIFYDVDPFPDILPALLNSADIKDYVTKTKLVHPFYEDDLKTASYGIRLKGEYIYWSSRDERQSGKLQNITEVDDDGNVVFTLLKNSIAFVELEPEFKLPVYIAARFNLRIKHVYQGLLLGTGPIIDPGFVGKIFIPLHNLTNNDYKIRISEPFIWMEFTKLSSNKHWNKSETRDGKVNLIDRKKYQSRKDLSAYLNEANPNGPILSTIPGILQDNKEYISKFEDRLKTSENEIRTATNNATKATNSFNRAIIVAIIALSITITITLYQTISIHNRTIDYMKESEVKQREQFNKYFSTEDEIINMKAKINDIEEKQRKLNESK